MSNHGTVKAEIADYRENWGRIVLCELQDGWHVIEVYRPGNRTQRHVIESLPDARRLAIYLLLADTSETPTP